LLPAFKVLVLIWTGDSGSTPEGTHGDKFLAVNDLTGNTAGDVRAVKAFKSFSLKRTAINCQVGMSFTALFFLSEIRHLCHLEDKIHSVGVPVSDP
jgi:hypothetical protein